MNNSNNVGKIKNTNLKTAGNFSNVLFSKNFNNMKSNLNNSPKPIPITSINDKSNILKNKIKPLNHSNEYGNFIPLPQNSQDIKIERDYTSLRNNIQKP